MKNKFLVFILMICLATAVLVSGCDIAPADAYEVLSDMSKCAYPSFSLNVVTVYKGETLSSQFTVTNDGDKSVVEYSVEQLTEISLTQPADGYKTTISGSVTVENGNITEQNGESVDIDFKQIGNVGFNFKREYFDTASFSEGKFTATVRVTAQFMGNSTYEYRNMTVEVNYGTAFEKIVLSYTTAEGATVTATYNFD